MWHFFHFIMTFFHYGHFNYGTFFFHILQRKYLNTVIFYLFCTYIIMFSSIVSYFTYISHIRDQTLYNVKTPLKMSRVSKNYIEFIECWKLIYV